MTSITNICNRMKQHEDDEVVEWGLYVHDSLEDIMEEVINEGVKYVLRAEDGVNEPAKYLLVHKIARMLGLPMDEINASIDRKLKYREGEQV